MKFLEAKSEYIHSWYLLIMSGFGLIFLLASKTLILNLLLACFLLFLYKKNGLTFLVMFKLMMYAFIFAAMFLLLNLIYPNNELRMGEQITILGFTYYKKSLVHGLNNCARLFLLSLFTLR